MPRDDGKSDELKKKIAEMPDTVSGPTPEQIKKERDAIDYAKKYAETLPPDSPDRKNIENEIARAEAKIAARERGEMASAEQQKQAAADPKADDKADTRQSDKKADEPYEYGEDANRRRGATAKQKQEEDALSNYAQSGRQTSQATNDGKLDMRNPGAGVPNRGSFANDAGGDKLLGESVPSNR